MCKAHKKKALKKFLKALYSVALLVIAELIHYIFAQLS